MPTVSDVRELPLDSFQKSIEAPNLDAVPKEFQNKFSGIDSNDTYLLWHVAHLDQLSSEYINVPAGSQQEINLTTNQAKKYSRLLWIHLEEGSSLQIIDTASEQEFFTQRIVVIQEARSQLNYWGVRFRNQFTNEKITVHLVGTESKTEVTHLLSGTAKDQSDISASIQHEGPNTTSNVVTRIALGEKAHSLYRGLIAVQETARGAEGYQKGQALATSRHTIVDMLPQLEIDTNEVRCTHSVTTSHLDDEALFYMRSRGLSEKDARQLALKGFFYQGLSIPKSLAALVKQAIHSVATSI